MSDARMVTQGRGATRRSLLGAESLFPEKERKSTRGERPVNRGFEAFSAGNAMVSEQVGRSLEDGGMLLEDCPHSFGGN